MRPDSIAVISAREHREGGETMTRNRTWVMAAVLVLLTVFSSSLLAVFVNGGFETGDFTGWTKSSYLNPGLVGTQPYSGASITRNPGGATNESVIVTAVTPEPGADGAP